MMASGGRNPIGKDHFEETASWIASLQEDDGMIPWARGGKMDPWDHVHAAMGLAVSGRSEAARVALRCAHSFFFVSHLMLGAVLYIVRELTALQQYYKYSFLRDFQSQVLVL